MKKVIRLLGIVALVAIIGFAMLGCEGPMGPQGPAGNSAELQITPPTKLNYGSGACNTEPLNLAGLKIFIKIDDEFIYIIPETQYKLFWNGTEINNGNTAITSESGTKTITIIDIIGRKATFEITVNSGHDFEYTSTTAPTCFDDGFDTYTCSICPETLQQNIVSAGHDFEYTATTAPTCFDDGFDTYTCSECPETEKRNIVNAGHLFEYTSTTPQTCYDGFDTYTCKACSDTQKRNIISGFGHDYGDFSMPIITSLTSPVLVLPAVCAHDPTHTIGGVTGTSLDDFLSKLTENTPDTPYHFVVNITGLTGSSGDNETLGNALYNNSTKFISLDLSGSTFSGNQIGNGAFYHCTGLTSITIPNSVTSIGDSAFIYCTGLTSITIPNSVTSIGDAAFQNCRSLTSITIPNSVTSIGDAAFQNCRSLTSITIPNSVTSIGEGVFADCAGLTSITIPNSVTSIGNWAFANCDSLNSVTFQGTIPVGDFREMSPFPGNLRDVFYSSNADNGTPGTYTATRTPGDGDTVQWTRQP